jgi:hypothetical protein
MAAFKIDGVQETINKLLNLSESGKNLAIAQVNVIADKIVLDAKQNAPADLGRIRQMIGKENATDDGLLVSVFAAAPESPFQEFGTGGKVDIPEDMTDIASQFQGQKGGGWEEFILALTDWVKRHGINPIGNFQISTKTRISKGNKRDIDEETAYGIARGILAHGLAPQPFLYPAFTAHSEELLPALQNALQQLMRQNQA